jgi:PKD repeat protein
VKVGYSATSITWKLSQVSGILPTTDITVANPVPFATESINGRTYYTYAIPQDVSFLAPGTYFVPVTYSAAVIENCSQSEKAEVKVVVKPGPKADFTLVGSACLNDSIHLNGSAVANSFNIVSYDWLFDDNTTATGINTAKKFTVAGPHDVRFRVFADNGCAGDTTKTINILEIPIAKFGVTSPACSGRSVLFTDSSTSTQGNIVTWNWNFGDGTGVSITNNNPLSHLYGNATNYTSSLVAISSNGCKSDTAKRIVTVVAGPTAKFGYDKNICIGDSIRFTDSSKIAAGNNYKMDLEIR